MLTTTSDTYARWAHRERLRAAHYPTKSAEWRARIGLAEEYERKAAIAERREARDGFLRPSWRELRWACAIALTGFALGYVVYQTWPV